VPLRVARAAVLRMVLATMCFGLLFACILTQHLDAFQCDWSRCAARTSGTRRRRRSGAPTRAATSSPAPSTPSNLRATTSDSKSCSEEHASVRGTHVGCCTLALWNVKGQQRRSCRKEVTCNGLLQLEIDFTRVRWCTLTSASPQIGLKTEAAPPHVLTSRCSLASKDGPAFGT